MDFIKHHSHFSFRFAFFLTLASLPTAPSGLGTQRDAAPASLCSSSRCFWLLTHPNLLLFTHFLRQAAWWVSAPELLLPALRGGWAVISEPAASAGAGGTSQAPHCCSFHRTTQASREESLSWPTAGRGPSSALLRNSELSLEPPSDAV